MIIKYQDHLNMSNSKSVVTCQYQDYLVLKNYSKRTIDTYSRFTRDFLDYCSDHRGLSLSFEDYARKYLLSLQARDCSWSTINGNYSAIKILCVKVLKKEWKVDHLPRPKSIKNLPRILSQKEIIRLIESPRSFKHRTIIMLMYVTGLRISEVLHLKLSDIDSDRKEIFVNQGKGHKDRMVQVPSKLLDLLRQYYKVYQPKVYLFEGRGKTTRRYSAGSINKILSRTREKCKIAKTISPHTLRHCYATHHLECGTDLVFLKEQLGHTNIRTTAKYIHLCRERHRHVNHPIDQLTIKIL